MDVLDRLLISEIIEVGFSNLVVNFGLVLVDGVSDKSWIAGVVSPTKDKSKHRPLDRLMRVTVLIVFLLEWGWNFLIYIFTKNSDSCVLKRCVRFIAA